MSGGSRDSRKLRSRIRMMCYIGVMAALYVVLALFVSIRAGNLRITFASLPVIVTAVLFGPGAGAAVALVGEFFNQLLTYGLSPTLPLWMLPPALRGLMVGLAARWLAKGGKLPESRPVPYYVCIVGAALLTTAANTVAIWLDSVFWGYYSFAYVFGATASRLVAGVVTAVLMATASIPLVRMLRGRV